MRESRGKAALDGGSTPIHTAMGCLPMCARHAPPWTEASLDVFGEN